MNKKIWLSPPHMEGQEIKEVNKVFKQNWIAPAGPQIDKFEEQLRRKLNVKAVTGLSSGTSAIHLALILLGVTKGDYVFCQSFTFSASANPIIYQGATPVFIDSEMNTWNMDPDLLETALNEASKKNKLPKAIIVVNLYGMPSKFSEIIKISNKYKIPIIEDSAESLGSKIGEKFAGSFGDFGILSFNGNKIITTSGGGALICPNKNYSKKAKFLSTQSRDNRPYYQHSEIGYNYRLSNVCAAIGIGQLKYLDKKIRARRNNFKNYYNYFTKINSKGFNIKFQTEPKGFYSNRWLTCVVIDSKDNNGVKSEKIRTHLLNRNIEVRHLWKPMHLQPVFLKYKAYLNGNSEYLFNNGLCLPSGSDLNKNDFDRIFETIDEIFNLNY